jgi:hypothetical protein
MNKLLFKNKTIRDNRFYLFRRFSKYERPGLPVLAGNRAPPHPEMKYGCGFWHFGEIYFYSV